MDFKSWCAACRLYDAVNDLLPEAFATVREASRRVLGMRHFDSQLVGERISFTPYGFLFSYHIQPPCVDIDAFAGCGWQRCADQFGWCISLVV